MKRAKLKRKTKCIFVISEEKKIEIKRGPRINPLAPLFVVRRSGMEKLIHRKKFHGRAVYSDTSIWLTGPDVASTAFTDFDFSFGFLFFSSQLYARRAHGLSRNF